MRIPTSLSVQQVSFVVLLLPALLGVGTASGQAFTNRYGELCYQLYEQRDDLGPFRVFVVIDDPQPGDTLVIQALDRMTPAQRQARTPRWVQEGKRIEVERAPYYSRPAQMPGRLKYPVLKPLRPDSVPRTKSWFELLIDADDMERDRMIRQRRDSIQRGLKMP